MNTFTLHLSLHLHRFRWFHVPAGILIALLQRAPVVPTVATADVAFVAGAGLVLKSIFASAVALGVVDTLAGATQLTANPPSPATATVGQPFQAAVAVTGAPLTPGSYEVTGTIAPGLSIAGLGGDLVNDSILSVTGTPTTAGSYTLNIRAWAEPNKAGLGGTPTFDYTINVAGSTQTAPVFTTPPQSQTVTVGSNVSFSVTVTGSPTPTLQWRKGGNALAGATSTTLNITNAQPADAGVYTVTAVNPAGSVTSPAATLTVNAAPAPLPTITSHPLSVTIRSGGTAVLAAAATHASSYQWRRNGAAIAGGTSASLILENVTTAAAGSYTVDAVNASGSVTSNAGELTVVAGGADSRLTNISVRTNLAVDRTLILGFVPVGERNMLIRAVGPTLNNFVSGAMSDPRLELAAQSGTVIETNDDWPANLAPVFASVGAFPLNPSSKDAALRRAIDGPHTALARGADAGLLLVEAYDSSSDDNGRLANVSARNHVGTGADVLIAGFFISGPVGKTLVIRGVGPALSEFMVPGVLADPKLEIFNAASVKIAENDDWAAALAPLAGRVGAFPLPVGGKDAALAISLPPGLYSAIVSGSANGTGEALIEVYELP